ncbi:MAG: hypothetical protein CMI18_04690 [Opitutaceae bacterium]|nr:hypothetical protein [Opitutaceae bacterium]
MVLDQKAMSDQNIGKVGGLPSWNNSYRHPFRFINLELPVKNLFAHWLTIIWGNLMLSSILVYVVILYQKLLSGVPFEFEPLSSQVGNEIRGITFEEAMDPKIFAAVYQAFLA